MNHLKQGTALALIVLCAGCVNYSGESGVENRWRTEEAAEWKVGETTAQAVMDALGPPSQLIRLDDATVYYYLREHRDGKGLFLLIYNLARFRDLRKSDEYSFSFEENDATTLDKQLATTLREGPNFGVHTLIWCDTFTNVGRWIDRQSMNDLALRVLFQMSASDSANLMDTPEASRLGIHRAVLYDEEQGEFEKFRPYGPPTNDWLTWVADQLAARGSSVA